MMSHISSICQMVNTRNHHTSTNNENNPPPPLTLEQVLLMQPKCFRLCNKRWTICIKVKVTNTHRNLIPLTSLASFRGPSHQYSHTRLSQWMSMIGLKPLKRNFKLCSATTGRWFCSPHISSRDLHPTGGMHMLMHMRKLTA
jgi:hypothetical protein